MQLSGNRLKNLRGPLMVGAAVCFFLGVVTYWYTDGFYFPPDPAPLPPPKAASARVTTTQIPPRVERPASPKPEIPSETPPMAADAGNLRTFAEKQAQLEVVKLEVAIAEQQAKLNELKNGKPVPIIQSIPQPVAVLPSELPPLPPLSATPQNGLPPLPMGPATPKRRTSGLVAVQGVDGNLAAVFATGSGKKTVRVGDAVMGSKIRSISLDGVTLASGKTITLED